MEVETGGSQRRGDGNGCDLSDSRDVDHLGGGCRMGVTIAEYSTAMMKRRGCYISWCFRFLQIVDGLAVNQESRRV